MASKVMVKIPVAPFAQVNKPKNGNVNGEIVLSRSPERPAVKNGADQYQKTPEQVRITQLEHNVKFLQEQHQLMLNGLHTEIESLKTRNRELQFQLIFARGPIPVNSPSSPSSPEEESKPKLYTSPKPPNTTPLQVELLEKELGEIKLQMQEIEKRNAHLSTIVDEQKKKLERNEKEREKEQQWVTQVDEADLLRKLDDAEMLIRRLRRENSDLRREAAHQATSGAQANAHQGHGSAQAQYHGGGSHFNKDNNGYQTRSQGNRGNSGRHRSGNNGHPGSAGHSNSGNIANHNGQHYSNRGGWFPPLHSQSFWQGGRQIDRQIETPNLPTLQQQMSESGGSTGHHHQYRDQYLSRRGGNNNHYRNNGEGGRTYRSGGHKNGKPS